MLRLTSLFALAACTQPPMASEPPASLASAKRVTAEEFFAGPRLPPVRTLAAALAADADAGYRIVYPPTPPEQTGGAMRPIVVPPARRPVTGTTWTVEWQLEVVLGPVQATREICLLASTRPLESPYALGGGNWLLCHPDFKILPQTVTQDATGPGFTYRPGTTVVRLSVPLDASLSGTTWHLQLLVKVPESGGIGHLLSPLLIAEVGSR